VQRYGRPGAVGMEFVHVTSVEQARSPFYVVEAMPDFEPSTDSELGMRILEAFLEGPLKSQGELRSAGYVF
jgi:hypothetical protein